MSISDTNREIAERAYACFWAGDLDGFMDRFTEDSQIIEADPLPYGGIYRGREECRKLLQAIVDTWTDISMDDFEVLGGEKYAVAYGHFGAAARSTGKRVRYPLAETWRIENGKVLTVTVLYFDTSLVSAAVV
jgi:ketosteroid isomerase-like protein